MHLTAQARNKSFSSSPIQINQSTDWSSSYLLNLYPFFIHIDNLNLDPYHYLKLLLQTVANINLMGCHFHIKSFLVALYCCQFRKLSTFLSTNSCQHPLLSFQVSRNHIQPLLRKYSSFWLNSAFQQHWTLCGCWCFSPGIFVHQALPGRLFYQLSFLSQISAFSFGSWVQQHFPYAVSPNSLHHYWRLNDIAPLLPCSCGPLLTLESTIIA